jgi:sugar lactone lactonase YvrE
MEISQVGDIRTGWGESLFWDEERSRLYFVDCLNWNLHWLDDGEVEPHAMKLPSMVTGIVPTDRGSIIGVLDDGLHVIDPNAGTTELLVGYPEGIGARGNDACADLDGNLVTGTLNMAPSPGSAWQFSMRHGWRLLDPAISNTNGPAAAVLDGAMTLIIGDTAADYFRYDYDAETATVGPRSVFGDVEPLDGAADGSTFDEDGGLWCALVDGGQLACFTTGGLDTTVALPLKNPTDVTFGGPDLDRLYVTSIGLGHDDPTSMEGALLVIDRLGRRGRPEPRFALA